MRILATIAARFDQITLTGQLVLIPEAYPNGRDALVLDTEEGHEWVSVNLPDQELPEPDCFFVKNYSEHTGLADSLVEADIAELVGSTTTGPFDSAVKIIRLS